MSIELLEKIIELVIAVLGIIITTYVIPYFKSRMSANELAELKEYITLSVRCAEMYFDTEHGKAKKDFVLRNVKAYMSKLTNSSVTDEELDVLIEGIVNQVKYSEYIVKGE